MRNAQPSWMVCARTPSSTCPEQVKAPLASPDASERRQPPERRHRRSDAELRKQREALKRQWEARQLRQGDAGTSADDWRTTMAQAQRRQSDTLVTMSSVKTPAGVSDSDIARRAYQLYEERGGGHGHDVDDWLQAERELRRALPSTAA